MYLINIYRQNSNKRRTKLLITQTKLQHRLWSLLQLQCIPRNMHTVFALLCFVVVIHWLIFPYPSGLLHWHCGNLTIAPVPAKQPWWIWINTSCEFIMNDCITTTKQSTTKPCAYFLGYTVRLHSRLNIWLQWIGQRQLQDKTRNIIVLELGATYVRGFTVYVARIGNVCMHINNIEI